MKIDDFQTEVFIRSFPCYVSDELTVKLNNVDMLKTSLQTDLPVMGFKPGSDTSKCIFIKNHSYKIFRCLEESYSFLSLFSDKLRDVLDKMKRNLDLLQTRDLQEFSEIAEAVEKIEKQFSDLKGTQKRYVYYHHNAFKNLGLIGQEISTYIQ